MARTPSMSADAAEALIGPRGATQIMTSNRENVKKWLVARGLGSSFVGTLKLAQMDMAYNDTTDAYLRELEAQASGMPQEDDASDESDDESRYERIVTETPQPQPQGNGHAASDEMKRLRELILGGWQPPQAALDADAVRVIIREELPGLIPTTRLEIKGHDGTLRDLGTMPRHELLPLAIKVIARGHNLLLVGPAGSGKTTAAEQIAAALGLRLFIQGPVAGAHEIAGYDSLSGRYVRTPFREAFEHGGLIILDEIDGSDPNGLLAINAALANGYAVFADSPEPVKRHEQFRCIAAANTFGMGADRVYVGRNQLDGATRDRFTFLEWGYDETLEAAICPNPAWVKRVQALRRGAVAEKARVIISPRASVRGAELLADGIDQKTVESLVIWKGIDPELRGRIERHA